MGNLALPEILIILAVATLYVLPLWRISRKMGYPGVLALLACLPGINILLAWFVAFTTWPVERQLESLRPRSSR